MIPQAERNIINNSLLLIKTVAPLDGTHLAAVRGLTHQEVPTSASTSGARRSDAATPDKDKHLPKYFAEDWIRC